MNESVRKVTWEEILARTNLVGGDIESVENHITYRGPLREIKRDGHEIIFTSPWRARYNGNKWEISTNLRVAVGDEVQPYGIGEGRIEFLIPSLGPCLIYPKTAPKLGCSKVSGLRDASVRLLELYPDLQFDRAVAESALTRSGFIEKKDYLDRLAADATLKDFLPKFVLDVSREEFLQHYISILTGSNDVFLAVY